MGPRVIGVSRFFTSVALIRRSRAGTIEATGDWFETRRTWMRVVRGKLQQAGPVGGAPSLVVCVFHSSEDAVRMRDVAVQQSVERCQIA